MRGSAGLVVLLAIVARAQGGASVEGRVINSATGLAVAGAQVVLQGDRDAYVRETGSDGRFQAADMVPGSYRARVQRAGYTALGRGVSQAKAEPRFTVAAGEHLRDLTLRMIPLAAISGRVLDADGDPVSKVGVAAMGYAYSRGRKELREFGRGSSDDHGDYHIGGLPPGRYFLQASQSISRSIGALSNLRVLGPSVPSAVAKTYFPSAADLADATPIDLGPGAEMGDRIILMRWDQACTIRITVTGPAGAGPNFMLTLSEPNGLGMGRDATYGTTYTFANRQTGDYYVGAEDRKLGLSANQWVKLSGDADVRLTLQPSPVMGGMMWVDGGGHVALEKASVALDNVRARYETDVNADGTFSFRRVRPGLFDIVVTPPAGAYLKTIQVGESVLDTPQFDGNRPGGAIGIVLGTDGGRLNGAVVDARGAAVDGASLVMVPAGGKRAWKTLVRTATAGREGKFEIGDLAPGEYRLIAFSDAEDGAALDEEFRRPFEASGMKVVVSASGSETVRVEAVAVAERR